MAEGFNNYFSEVGAFSADKIERTKENTFLRLACQKEYLHHSFLTQQILQKFLTSFLLFKLASQMVMTTFLHFFLKSAIKVLAFSLAHLFNCSFKLGMFPDCPKVAKVLPVYKSGEKSELRNYHPISILFSIYQVLEKLIHLRSSAFLNKHSILLPT